MIKGWIIKKVGEDIYFGATFDDTFDEDWDWTGMPNIYQSEKTAIEIADNLSKTFPNIKTEIKRADIFITP